MQEKDHMTDQTEKILYINTSGEENMEKASMPFVLANAAMAMDIEAKVVMQGPSVTLAQKGFADKLGSGGGFPPIGKLISDFLELGGEIMVCVPCMEKRNITVDDLVPGAVTTAAGKVNLAALEADAVLVF